MPIKMLALDLDGTLAVDGHQVLPATRRELKKLQDAGVEVVIATGRRYRTTCFVIDNLGFEVYAVCNGGALVKTPGGETLCETTYSTSQVNTLVHIARSMAISLLGQRDAHIRGGPDFIIDNQSSWSTTIQKYHDDNDEWSGEGDMLDRAPEFLVTGTMGEEDELREFVSEIQRATPGTYNSIVVPNSGSYSWYCEITLANVTKWYGLRQLANLFGITSKNICAVGDEVNDLPMLKEVAHGVAMGNGVDSLHDHARFVCGNNDEDGILEVIDYIQRHNQSTSQ